jgi:hypothetical protein
MDNCHTANAQHLVIDYQPKITLLLWKFLFVTKKITLLPTPCKRGWGMVIFTLAEGGGGGGGQVGKSSVWPGFLHSEDVPPTRSLPLSQSFTSVTT